MKRKPKAQARPRSTDRRPGYEPDNAGSTPAGETISTSTTDDQNTLLLRLLKDAGLALKSARHFASVPEFRNDQGCALGVIQEINEVLKPISEQMAAWESRAEEKETGVRDCDAVPSPVPARLRRPDENIAEHAEMSRTAEQDTDLLRLLKDEGEKWSGVADINRLGIKSRPEAHDADMKMQGFVKGAKWAFAQTRPVLRAQDVEDDSTVPAPLVDAAREFFSLYDSKVPAGLVWKRVQQWIFAGFKEGVKSVQHDNQKDGK